MTIHSLNIPPTMDTYSTEKDTNMHDLLPNLSVNLPNPMQPRNIYFEARILPNEATPSMDKIFKPKFTDLPPPYPRTSPALLSHNASSSSLADSSYYSSSAISDYSSPYEDSEKEFYESPSAPYQQPYYPLTAPAFKRVDSLNRSSSIRMLLNSPDMPSNHYASQQPYPMTSSTHPISSASSSPQIRHMIHDTNMLKPAVKYPYQCSYCPKAFIRPSSLKVHIYSHTGEKPFVCSYPGCERRFSVQSNMKRHLRVHSS